jgi:hypothetical protein
MVTREPESVSTDVCADDVVAVGDAVPFVDEDATGDATEFCAGSTLFMDLDGPVHGEALHPSSIGSRNLPHST